MTLPVIGAQHVLELDRRLELLSSGPPFRDAVRPDLDQVERLSPHGLVLLEYPDFRSLDEGRVVAVHAEQDDRLVPAAGRRRRPRDFRWLRRHVEAPLGPEVVEAELDVGLLQRHIRTPLYVSRAPAGIIDRLAVDGDPHQIEAEWVLRAELSGDRGDLDALMVVQYGEFVIDHLGDHVRAIALHEAGVDDVVRVKIAAPLVLGLRIRQPELHLDGLHRPPRPGRGESDVVSVHHGSSSIEPHVAGVADESQPHVRLVVCIFHCATQIFRIPGRYQRLTGFNPDCRDPSPWRIVDLGHDLCGGSSRTKLWFVGQLLQRIVVPELDLDASIQSSTPGRLVRGEGLGGPATVAGHSCRRQIQRILDLQRDPARPRLGQRQMSPVDLLLPAQER